jgi:hypothetical protein
VLLTLFATRTRLGTSAALAPRMAKDMVLGGGGGVKVDAMGVRQGSCGDLSVEGAAWSEDRRARNLPSDLRVTESIRSHNDDSDC